MGGIEAEVLLFHGGGLVYGGEWWFVVRVVHLCGTHIVMLGLYRGEAFESSGCGALDHPYSIF